VLQLAAVEATLTHLLFPLLKRLQTEGYAVHVACTPGERWLDLAREGFVTWPVPIARRALTPAHFTSLWRLYRLMKAQRFDIVHVHTPVAAVLGRLAAAWAGVPHVVYTAHGFYFHERMRPWARRSVVAVEKLLGRCCTDVLLSQSREDVDTTIREGIIAPERVRWIGNGVEVERFRAASLDPTLRASLGLKPQERVVGFIGRLVREKGVEALLRALARVRGRLPEVRLLVVGDSLQGERDRGAKNRVRALIEQLDLGRTVVLAGQREDVPALLKLMDVFTLPSHREGMPRSVLEAMASGLPVVATDIRGCREEVVDGQTGHLVPVGDVEALSEALLALLQDEEKARVMGLAGQARATTLFDERAVLERQLDAYRTLL